jgi:hypothetical protein
VSHKDRKPVEREINDLKAGDKWPKVRESHRSSCGKDRIIGKSGYTARACQKAGN